MRINYNNYSVLKCLDTDDKFRFKIDTAFGDDPKINYQNMLDLVGGVFETYKQVSHRYLLTEPFTQALEKVHEKIIKDDLHLKYVKPDCGLIFVKNTFALYLKDPQDGGCKLSVFSFNKEALTSFGMIYEKPDKTYVYGGRYYQVDDNGNSYHDQNKLIAWMDSICSVLYFIDNCETETKVVPAKKKEKFKGEKYLNETNNNLTVLDCGWFTELIRDTPFHVNGHLRWQPCGERHSKRKLIWVDSFEKKGYNRKPKKELV